MAANGADATSSALASRYRDAHVLVVTLERHAKRNAVNRELADAINGALDELDDDDSLWAGVLTGGPAFFSAGSDVTSGGDYVTERGGEYGIIRRRRRKPLVAAVEGFALGGGLEMVLACDLIVAASDARFGLPEVSIGVVPTCGGLFRGPQALPLNVAREMILTGDPISAERGHQVGFVNVLTEPGGALPAAVALAQRISRNAPLSVQACLGAVDDQLAEQAAPGWEATERAAASIRGTEDAAEGVRAFLEKRPPQWRSR